jgi:hypothetical protein
MSATQLRRCLKPKYQERVDLTISKPFVLKRIWDWDSEKETWKEDEIARSKSLNGIKAFCRLNKIPNGTGEYRIEKEWIEEFIEGWYPSFDEELVEEL